MCYSWKCCVRERINSVFCRVSNKTLKRKLQSYFVPHNSSSFKLYMAIVGWPSKRRTFLNGILSTSIKIQSVYRYLQYFCTLLEILKLRNERETFTKGCYSPGLLRNKYYCYGIQFLFQVAQSKSWKPKLLQKLCDLVRFKQPQYKTTHATESQICRDG